MEKDKAYDLILYCKLLKYLRTFTITVKSQNSAKIYIFKTTYYNDIVKDRCVPYIAKSTWSNEPCFRLHPIRSGRNVIVLFSTLKDVKL